MTDDALRVALLSGHWRALLALSASPTAPWWPAARKACAEAPLAGCGFRVVVPRSADTWLAWLRDLADSRCLTPDELRTLDRLERWAAGVC